MTSSIRFGTDGWRAIIGREFTFRNLEIVAQAYADYLNSTELQRRVVIGYDNRFLSEQFASCCINLLEANGIEVLSFSESTPTPLVSWAVVETKSGGGIVITASHNPPEFNGFKIKAEWGGSATQTTTQRVELLIEQAIPKQISADRRDTSQLSAATESYRSQINSLIDIERIRGMDASIVIDPMHGSAGRWTESFLDGGKLKPLTIRSNRDPLFGGVNPEPIDKNLGTLKEAVLKSRAVAGVATDGDADRVGAVDELGRTMTMHDVVPLVLLHLCKNRNMKGGVVRTFSQSVLTKRISEEYNLKVFETPIGFKYIADLMLKEDILLGAEESGGIGVKGHIPERDGILNSLLFLEAVAFSGQTPSRMVASMHKEYGHFYYGRHDLHMQVEQGREIVSRLASDPPSKIAGQSVKGIETLDGTKLTFADESWLLFRQSGTEPVLRIYSEATSTGLMQSLIEQGSKLMTS